MICPARSRRSLLVLLLTLIILFAAGGMGWHRSPAAAAAAGARALATVGNPDGVALHRKASGKAKTVATLAPGTTVELVDGPTEDGWYRVEAVDLPEATSGWLRADDLWFDRFVRAESDLALYAEPSDWSGAVAWVRHGFVLTVRGPGAGDFLLVQYGDQLGYAYAPAVQASDGPATDPWGERWVDVNRSTWEVRLMVGETVVDTFEAALSRDQGEGFYATAVGTYSVYQKIEGLTYTPYAKAYIAYWAGFDPDRFNGFHGWTMDKYGNVIDGGWGPTAGCVATSPEIAIIIYEFVEIGTRVEVHW